MSEHQDPHAAEEGVEDRRAESVDPQLLREIARLLLPQPEVLPLIVAAFGPNEGALYDGIHDVIVGQPADTQGDLGRYADWLEEFNGRFRECPPVRPIHWPTLREFSPDLAENPTIAETY